MAKKAPGKNHRKGLSIVELMDKFPTEDLARAVLRQVVVREAGREDR